MQISGASSIEGGTTIPEAAEQCGVSISSVVRFLKLHQETGLKKDDIVFVGNVSVHMVEGVEEAIEARV